MPTSGLLRRIETIVPRRAASIGGKARNLAALARAGFPVPAAWALSGDAFVAHVGRVLPERDRLPALLAGPESGVDDARLAEIADRVRRSELGADVVRALDAATRDLLRTGARAIAVRSSSTHEDDERASAAGLHATVLQVRTLPAVLDAVREAWASAFTPRAIAYLRGLPDGRSAAIGVVLQAMVPADASGVLFTVNPLTGDTTELLIDATWGLGAPLVEGRVAPDSLRVDKASGLVRDRVTGDKRVRLVVRDGVLREEPVPDDEALREVLSGTDLARLVGLGRRIEAQFGGPRDVEWALAGGELYVLQARPVTALVPRPPPSRRARERGTERARFVWSNVNVGEALPGVATPLTWSVLSRFAELGFRRAFGALGCRVPREAELVGSFRGRIYLNLTDFMAIASQVPGVSPGMLLSFAGGGEATRLEAQTAARGRLAYVARLPLTVARFLRENVAITARVAAHEEHFEREYRRLSTLDLRILEAAGLAHTLRDVEALLDATGAVTLSVYGNLLACAVVLRRILELVAKDRAEVLERGLTSGLADLESAAPGLALWHIAEMARVEVPARDALIAGAKRLEDLPAGPTRRALTTFLAAHGGRGPREAEIAEPRWREDPSMLFAVLRQHLARPPGGEDPLAIERRQRARREDAERDVDGLVPPLVRAALRHLLALLQRFVRLRERLRGHVTAVLGLYRSVALEAARRLDAREQIGPDGAFFLTVPELRAVLLGGAGEIAPLVRARRAQYRRDVALPDPPDTFVGYPPPAPAPTPDTDRLVGVGASGGRASGIVRVLHGTSDAASLRSGEVLVAPYADVGWSPLFLVASAVVTDLGGALSHAAIIAREYGVPTVMNVKVGTRVLRTGDRVEVDGDAGTVRVLERAT